MVKGKTFVDYSQFSSYLLGLCRQSGNGTIFLTGRDNVAGAISLRNGEIVGISCRAKKGSAALEFFQSAMQKCTFRFKEQLIMQTDTDLPDEGMILQSLGLRASDIAAVLAERDAASCLFSRDPDTRSPVLHIESRVFRAIIERNAIAVFGPMGKTICSKHLGNIDKIKTLDDLRWLLRVISDEVGDEVLQKQFIEAVLQHLGYDMRRARRD